MDFEKLSLMMMDGTFRLMSLEANFSKVKFYSKA
jgi:hypothetical protein